MRAAQNRRRILAVMLIVALHAACTRDPEVAKREYVDSGDSFLRQHKLKEAIVQYRNAVRQDPRFGEARSKLAEVYTQDGDWRRAGREVHQGGRPASQGRGCAVEGRTLPSVRAAVRRRRDARAQCAGARRQEHRRRNPARQRAGRLEQRRRGRRDIEEAIKLDPNNTMDTSASAPWNMRPAGAPMRRRLSRRPLRSTRRRYRRTWAWPTSIGPRGRGRKPCRRSSGRIKSTRTIC